MKAIYKCRLCGKVYHSTAPGCTAEKDRAAVCMVQLHVGVVGIVAPAPTMTETHHCRGDHAGSLGLADFQGWEKEE